MFTVSASSSQSSDVVQKRSTTPARTAAATATPIERIAGCRRDVEEVAGPQTASGGRRTVRTSATSIGSTVIEGPACGRVQTGGRCRAAASSMARSTASPALVAGTIASIGATVAAQLPGVEADDGLAVAQGQRDLRQRPELATHRHERVGAAHDERVARLAHARRHGHVDERVGRRPIRSRQDADRRATRGSRPLDTRPPSRRPARRTRAPRRVGRAASPTASRHRPGRVVRLAPAHHRHVDAARAHGSTLGSGP